MVQCREHFTLFVTACTSIVSGQTRVKYNTVNVPGVLDLSMRFRNTSWGGFGDPTADMVELQ